MYRILYMVKNMRVFSTKDVKKQRSSKSTKKHRIKGSSINKGTLEASSKTGKTQVQRGYLPLAQKYFVRLPYVENYVITGDGTTGLSVVQNIFNGNNIYDPRYNTGGHQPLQYDQISPAYERIWVWGAKVTLTFSNPDYSGMYVGYRVRGHTNGVTTGGQTLEYLQEMREAKMKVLNKNGEGTVQFKFYVNNPKVLGLSKSQYNNLEYSHPNNGSPAVATWIEPFAIHTVSGENSNVRCNIRITYYAQLTNPVSQAQS